MKLPHGKEKTRYVKEERHIKQTIVVYEDGCLETTIVTISHRGGTTHTAEPYKWGAGINDAKALASSGFHEDIDDLI